MTKMRHLLMLLTLSFALITTIGVHANDDDDEEEEEEEPIVPGVITYPDPNCYSKPVTFVQGGWNSNTLKPTTSLVTVTITTCSPAPWTLESGV